MKVPFFTVLGLIFITLKLCGTITWSWWWVTAPLWGGFALLGALVLIGFVIAAIAHLAK